MPELRPTSDGLIRTKLAPPRLHGAFCPRAALLARLETGLVRKVTLVSAPVGSGKSTLVADWWSSHQAVAAWIALDGGDNDPVRFWRYLLTACAKFDPALGKAGLATLATAQQPPFTDLLTTFINELAQLAHRYALVLEDYHVIVEPDVHASLAFLIDHLPDTLHLILITRSEPELPLARLRARNELSEVGIADLRFSELETAESCSRPWRHPYLPPLRPPSRKPRVGPRVCAWLRWPWKARRRRRKPSNTWPHSQAGTATSSTISSVKCSPPNPKQCEPSSQTSLLQRLTGSLCDAVTGSTGSAELLEQLEHADLFLIPLAANDDQPWYRYHALFAEAMRHDAQRRLGAEGVAAVYANASRWYETHALLSEAVETAMLAGQFERAVTLMEQLIDAQGYSELYTLLRWAEQIPAHLLASHPALSFNYALAILFISSDRYAPANTATIDWLLRSAEEAWQRDEDEARLGQVLAVRSVVHLWQGDLVNCFAGAQRIGTVACHRCRLGGRRSQHPRGGRVSGRPYRCRTTVGAGGGRAGPGGAEHPCGLGGHGDPRRHRLPARRL